MLDRDASVQGMTGAARDGQAQHMPHLLAGCKPGERPAAGDSLCASLWSGCSVTCRSLSRSVAALLPAGRGLLGLALRCLCQGFTEACTAAGLGCLPELRRGSSAELLAADTGLSVRLCSSTSTLGSSLDLLAAAAGLAPHLLRVLPCLSALLAAEAGR